MLSGHAHREGTQWRGQPIERSFNLGTMSSLSLVRKEAVIPIEVDIPFPSACIVGCGVMTGATYNPAQSRWRTLPRRLAPRTQRILRPDGILRASTS